MTEKAAQDMDTSDLRGRVVALEQQAVDRTQRIVNLEMWQRQMDISDARREEKWLHLDEKFNALDEKISAISGSISWINKLVIGGLVMGAVAFVISGGLNIP